MAHWKKYVLSMLLPIGLLTASGIANPHLFSVTVFSNALPPLPDRPVPLYRRGNLALFYTSRDLLHPEDFGKPGEFYQSVVFDIWPANEGQSTPVQSLTWIRQITWAVSARDADGNPLSNTHATDVDENLARDFMRTFAGPPRLERGQVTPFLLPVESSYRALSGVRAFVSMAIKDPGEEHLLPKLNGSSQLFGPGLDSALKEVSNHRLTGVGLPFMQVSSSLGQQSTQINSWKTILEEADAKAARTRLKVVLGGYGLLPQNRDQTDRSFRQAWVEWQSKLVSDQNDPMHEPIRLTALIALVATAGAAVRKRRFALRRIAAIVVISASIAAAVIGLFDWTRPLWPAGLLGGTTLVIKVVLGVAAGIFIDQIVKFDSKKVLSQGD